MSGGEKLEGGEVKTGWEDVASLASQARNLDYEGESFGVDDSSETIERTRRLDELVFENVDFTGVVERTFRVAEEIDIKDLSAVRSELQEDLETGLAKAETYLSNVLKLSLEPYLDTSRKLGEGVLGSCRNGGDYADRISVDLEMPVSSVTCLYEWSCNNPSACCICFLLYKRGCPSLKSGCFFAIALPSFVRSIIMSRSNSAKASMILRISFPVGVLSINPMFNTWTVIPLFNNAWIISVPCDTLLAILSNFVITSLSPCSSLSRSLSSSGLCDFVPVKVSEYIFSAPFFFNNFFCASRLFPSFACIFVETLQYP